MVDCCCWFIIHALFILICRSLFRCNHCDLIFVFLFCFFMSVDDAVLSVQQVQLAQSAMWHLLRLPLKPIKYNKQLVKSHPIVNDVYACMSNEHVLCDNFFLAYVFMMSAHLAFIWCDNNFEGQSNSIGLKMMSYHGFHLHRIDFKSSPLNGWLMICLVWNLLT